MATRIVYRKGIGGYLLDELMGVNDEARRQKKAEEVKEFCSDCGKKGIFAQCSKKRCKKVLCKSCSIKKKNKYFCEKHY